MTPPRRLGLSVPAAWTLLGAGIVSASAALIAQPGFNLGTLVLSLLALVAGRVVGEMALVAWIERASGLGKLLWEGLVATRWGELVGKENDKPRVQPGVEPGGLPARHQCQPGRG